MESLSNATICCSCPHCDAVDNVAINVPFSDSTSTNSVVKSKSPKKSTFNVPLEVAPYWALVCDNIKDPPVTLTHCSGIES